MMEDKYVYVELKTLQVYQCFTNYSVYEPFQLWSMLTYIKKFSVRMYSSRNYIIHTHTHTHTHDTTLVSKSIIRTQTRTGIQPTQSNCTQSIHKRECEMHG